MSLNLLKTTKLRKQRMHKLTPKTDENHQLKINQLKNRKESGKSQKGETM